MDYLEAAIHAAKKAGSVLMDHFGKLTDIQNKSYEGDLVTEADRESEEVILEYLQTQFPTHSFLAEESGSINKNSKEYLWVIDPLDGTTNYAHQFPNFSVSIALNFNGKPIVGVVFNPYYNELFTATSGKGAKLNGNAIHVSKIKTLQKSLLVTGFAYDRRDNIDNNYNEFSHMTQISQGVRRMGSASLDLAFVACGRLDGYWEKGLKEWDVAAGILLVVEAGGKATDYDEDPIDLHSGRVLATNGLIHKLLSQELLNT